VFKNHKIVDKCVITAKAEEDTIAFDMNCKLGVKKTYRLDIEECEPMQAVYSKEQCPNKIVVQAQILSMSLNSFPAKLEEITLVLERDHVRLKSYMDNVAKHDDLRKKLFVTELVLNPTDFENYEFRSDRSIELAFCLKEIKAIIGFCDKQGQTISMWMNTEGKPLLISVTLSRAYDADFVLATLETDSSDKLNEPSQSTSETSRSTGSSQSRPTGITGVSGSRSSPSSIVSQIQPGSPQSSPNMHTPPLSGGNAPKRVRPPSNGSSLQSSKRTRTNKEEDNEDFLWDKDMQSKVLHDNEDSEDVPDSQED